MPAASRLRCAIYTRKSSEEGLDQSYNSLDAQRDACEAYVMSQTGEGWSALPTHYDDGGFSGGTMDRPGLRQLLADIAAKCVDVVVVYKVDRLTRSLTDFARIVETFDTHGVSFVSVTQAFNTTSSMGRLTLNVLLSFAQFEREVTGERIRDKIAASKRRGMWMGGTPPLGYRPHERTLVVDEAEAETVRHIYRRYLALGSVRLLREELACDGIRSPGRRTGKPGPFARGALYHLLTNRLYLGEIVHKGESFPGLHAAIIDPEMFDTAATLLATNTQTRRARTTACAEAPLIGRLFDEDGRAMSPVHARNRHGRVYRYYVSSRLQRGEAQQGLRIPASTLDDVVRDRLARIFPSVEPEALWQRLVRVIVSNAAITLVVEDAPKARSIAVAPSESIAELPDGHLQLSIPSEIRTWGGRSEIIRPDRRRVLPATRIDPVLSRGLGQAHQLVTAMKAAPGMPLDELARARGTRDSYVRRLSRLAFLAPDIQEAILDGRQPIGINLQTLMQIDIPLGWDEQRQKLGFTIG